MNARNLRKHLKDAKVTSTAEGVRVQMRGVEFNVARGSGWTDDRELAGYLASKIPVAAVFPPHCG